MAKVVVLREILSYSHLISLCFINVSKFLYVSSYFPVIDNERRGSNAASAYECWDQKMVFNRSL
jgi:hypothetical protein